jgi:hypothetical protein
MAQKVNYSDTTPAADANQQLLKWKADAPSSDPTIIRNIAVEVPKMTASGGGHQPGIVPDPPSVAGTTKFLREDATWVTPAGAAVMGPSGAGHATGLTPDTPAVAGSTKFLREDATWVAPPTGSASAVFGNGSSIFSMSDVTASRVVNTVYQNTTGKHILVIIGMNNGSASATLSVLTDAANPPTTTVWAEDSAASNLLPIMFLVKNNDFYKLTVSAGTPAVPIAWLEYQMTTATVTDSGDLGPGGTAARALATVYQNTSGSPKIVMVRITGAATSRLTAISDSAAAPTATVCATDTLTAIGTLFFWVPDTHYYKVTAAAGAIASWREYTIAGVTCVKSADLSTKATANASPKRQVSSLPNNNAIAQGNSQTGFQMYVNTTGKDVWVSPSHTGSNAGTTSRFLIDTEPAIPPQIGISQHSNGAAKARCCQGLVQPGQPYLLCLDGGSTSTATLLSWFEYQLS